MAKKFFQKVGYSKVYKNFDPIGDRTWHLRSRKSLAFGVEMGFSNPLVNSSMAQSVAHGSSDLAS
jgi:hypothetical protein